MNPQLKQAITAFVLNEFKLEPKLLDPDFDFLEDLGLNSDQLLDFLQRLQDALSVVIPEEKIAAITTLGDLYSAINPEDDNLD